MKKMVIWPAYLAAGKTKSEGRLVARKHAVKSPKVEEIESVARTLNLEPEVEKEKAYPKAHWDKSGRVLVTKKGRKGEIVQEIANGIKELREKSKTKSGGK
ncbi:MAG: signal recognition particle protein Srp19 [Methanomicrobia archaeon]|nr:signal recognition particle protein Srp19 [Methanomicrobia archaeon]